MPSLSPRFRATAKAYPIIEKASDNSAVNQNTVLAFSKTAFPTDRRRNINDGLVGTLGVMKDLEFPAPELAKTYGMPFAAINPLLFADIAQTVQEVTTGLQKIKTSKRHTSLKKTWLATQTTLSILTHIPNIAIFSWAPNKNVLTLMGPSILTPPMTAAMLFALSVRGLSGAGFNLWKAYLAHRKTDASYLLQDRKVKLNFIQEAVATHPSKAHQTRLTNQIKALQPTDNNPDSHESKLKQYLLGKQSAKRRIFFQAAFGLSLMGVGTLFGGLAILMAPIPPVAAAFGIVSATCLGLSALNKIRQIYQRHKMQKTVQAGLFSLANQLTQSNPEIQKALQDISEATLKIKSAQTKTEKKEAEKTVQTLQKNLRKKISHQITKQRLGLSADAALLDYVSAADIEKILMHACIQQKQAPDTLTSIKVVEPTASPCEHTPIKEGCDLGEKESLNEESQVVNDINLDFSKTPFTPQTSVLFEKRSASPILTPQPSTSRNEPIVLQIC